jgi:hypothetical protein
MMWRLVLMLLLLLLALLLLPLQGKMNCHSWCHIHCTRSGLHQWSSSAVRTAAATRAGRDKWWRRANAGGARCRVVPARLRRLLLLRPCRLRLAFTLSITGGAPRLHACVAGRISLSFGLPHRRVLVAPGLAKRPARRRRDTAAQPVRRGPRASHAVGLFSGSGAAAVSCGLATLLRLPLLVLRVLPCRLLSLLLLLLLLLLQLLQLLLLLLTSYIL